MAGSKAGPMGRAMTVTKILLVEDEALISDLVADALIEQGFAVHAVETADDALLYLEAGGEVDVLFTDINLPGAIDGAELAVRARKLRPELPIVYASGRFTASDLNPLVPRSIFLSKPYDPADVCTLISRLAPLSH
jgi:CheY-like chemotaxis protein